jgi:hypothetical protein
VLPVLADEPGPDDHFCIRRYERLADLRNIGGFVLAVAIDANHVVETKFESDFVARLHASAHSKMDREPKHERAGVLRNTGGGIGREVVDNQDRHVGQYSTNGPDNVTDGCLFIEGGHYNH